jgi:hypothetical protein
MPKKNAVISAFDLTERRKEELKRMSFTTMRSHGKLWSMDVFAWYDADPELLTNTILAFPFPVVWVTRLVGVHEALQFDQKVISNIDSILVHSDNDLMNIDLVPLKKTSLISCVDVKEALQTLENHSPIKRIVLFTSHGQHVSDDSASFEEFITTRL